MTTDAAESTPVPPATALGRLLSGNRRFLAGRGEAHRDFAAARAAAAGQAPAALVVTCVDSRLPVETVFDQSFGDVCVIRSAGHVLDHGVLASVELSVAVLGVSVVMVLGHQRCGAIRYAVDTAPADAPGELRYLVDQIAPCLADVDADPASPGADRYERVMRRHVARSVEQLRYLPAIRAARDAGRLWLVGARYDLGDAKVSLIR